MSQEDVKQNKKITITIFMTSSAINWMLLIYLQLS